MYNFITMCTNIKYVTLTLAQKTNIKDLPFATLLQQGSIANFEKIEFFGLYSLMCQKPIVYDANFIIS